MYVIKEKLIHNNRSHKPLKPQGLAIHSTATAGATDEAEQAYFDKAKRGASAHYFSDWDSITRLIPENEQAWHAGPTANSRLLSYEMCEPKGNDFKKFLEVWNRVVWFAADCCMRYRWDITHIYSHDMISKKWPVGYLASYGRTFDGLKQAIDREIAKMQLAKKLGSSKPATTKTITLKFSPGSETQSFIRAVKAEFVKLAKLKNAPAMPVHDGFIWCEVLPQYADELRAAVLAYGGSMK
jgi:N-acetylmuramoyl-L-alanine amidase CwlA